MQETNMRIILFSNEWTPPMNTNPCLECPRINDDKNNPDCLKCDKRIRYVKQLSGSLGCYVLYADDGGDLNVCCPSENPLP
jgi:uncharacterized paraquat-inducible protein A